MDASGLAEIVTTPLWLALILVAQTISCNARALPSLLQLQIARSSTAKTALEQTGVHGRASFAIMLCSHARTPVVQTLQANVVDALVMINVALVADVIRGLASQALVIATVTTTLIAVAVCRTPTVCGILILTHIANPRSNVISLIAA